MGHASCRAALIYPHSNQHRQRVLADVIAEPARKDLEAALCGRVWHAKDIPIPLMIIQKAHATRLSCAFRWWRPEQARTCDLPLRRSFPATPLPGQAQVGQVQATPQVSVSNRRGGLVLARMWHGTAPDYQLGNECRSASHQHSRRLPGYARE